jgi:hypothetical protein
MTRTSLPMCCALLAVRVRVSDCIWDLADLNIRKTSGTTTYLGFIARRRINFAELDILVSEGA